MTYSVRADGGTSGAGLIGFGPKLRVSDSAAVLLPVGFEHAPPGAWWRSGPCWRVQPMIVVTRRLGDRKELNVAAQYLARLGIHDDDMLGVSVGFGLRPKEGRMILRPEVGVAFEEGEGIHFQASFGVSFRTR